MGEHVACIGDLKNAYKILIRKSERKKPLGKPRHSKLTN
jgi:hypothetical protein